MSGEEEVKEQPVKPESADEDDPPLATLISSSKSSPHPAPSSSSSGKRKRNKKDSDGFSDHYLTQYGLSLAQDPATTFTSIRVLECRFCRVFGREAAPGRIRAVSRKIHQWKGPFKTHNFTIHLTVCHAEKWKIYQTLESDEAKEAFFGVDHSQLLAIANAAAAAADSRDRAILERNSLTVGGNGLPVLNSNTRDAHLGAKKLKMLSGTPTGAVSSHAINTGKHAFPVRTIRFQRGNRTLDLMHEIRNNPNETMRALVRQAKQDDLMNVFDATRNHGKNRARNNPPKHLFFTVEGVGSFSEPVFLKTPVHGIFSLSPENPLVVELEYRVVEESSSEDTEGDEEEEGGEEEYAEQVVAAAVRQIPISPPQQHLHHQHHHPQQQQPLPPPQPRFSTYPHQFPRTGFWMH